MCRRATCSSRRIRRSTSTSSRCACRRPKSLLERRDAIIVATVSAIYGIGDPVEYHSMILHSARARKSQRSATCIAAPDRDAVRRATISISGAAPSACAATCSTFSRPSMPKLALRIALFDDEVESLQLFDPLTGHVLQAASALHRLSVEPLCDAARDRPCARSRRSRRSCASASNASDEQDKLVEAQRIEQRTRFDLEMLQRDRLLQRDRELFAPSVGRQPGEPPPTLIDYLPPDALMFIDESHVTIPQIGGMYSGDRARKENLVDYGFRLPSALDNRPLRFDEFETHDAADDLRFGHARPTTSSSIRRRWSSRWCGRRACRSADRSAAGVDAGRRPAVGDQRAHQDQ